MYDFSHILRNILVRMMMWCHLSLCQITGKEEINVRIRTENKFVPCIFFTVIQSMETTGNILKKKITDNYNRPITYGWWYMTTVSCRCKPPQASCLTPLKPPSGSTCRLYAIQLLGLDMKHDCLSLSRRHELWHRNHHLISASRESETSMLLLWHPLAINQSTAKYPD